MNQMGEQTKTILWEMHRVTPEEASHVQLYEAVSRAAMRVAEQNWRVLPAGERRACYFSAEFLMGRMVYSNLMNLSLLGQVNQFLAAHGIDTAVFETIEDAALGNGGLGRLAACFLDSAATHGIPLDGYGIRYRWGLFRQFFEDGFQREKADDWLRFGDPWSIRKEDEKVMVHFKGQSVWAVPYDSPVVGYANGVVNTLRLWQAEPVHPFDFTLFNEQKYTAAVKERNDAEAITSVLYPNDDTVKGKRLRLKQQYFFVSASLQDMLRRLKKVHGGDVGAFAQSFAIQLNDTHPVVAIPELIRLLMKEGVAFDKALCVAKEAFSYTNHTVLPEALEKWGISLFRSVLPEIYRILVRINQALMEELDVMGLRGEQQRPYLILEGDTIHMARLAIFASRVTNGVSAMHTKLLQDDTLKNWYAIYPKRFQNKTNGITQRRWLKLCNPELSALITGKIGEGWVTDLTQLEQLKEYLSDKEFLKEFQRVKQVKKQQLAEVVLAREGVAIHPDFLFDVQVKRLHEYKRQLLSAFGILDTYFALKEGKIQNFTPTLYLFGAKAAPGYLRAKGIIKYLNEISALINRDKDMSQRMQLVFVQNYDVSYAEKIIPAANVSEQISLAGTEASGTGNMKLMLNGAVTLGTFDGANVEIVEAAGRENNYIFGASVEEIESIRQEYNPKAIYESDERVHRVLDTLVDGTVSDGGTGWFRELYDSILQGASWHRPDQYFLLHDFSSYCKVKLQVNQDYQNQDDFMRKCAANMANAGRFSSDRTVKEYAKGIWRV